MRQSTKAAGRLSHIDAAGRARMVDVGGKDATRREASAEAILAMKAETLALIVSGRAPKGDVLAVARVAEGDADPAGEAPAGPQAIGGALETTGGNGAAPEGEEEA